MKLDGRSDRTIAVGESSEATFTIDTKRRSGNFNKRVTVYTNDPDNAQTYLTCEAVVKVPFMMNPQSAVFSTISRDSEGENRTIKLTRGDAGPIHLNMEPVVHENIEAKLTEITPGEEYQLDIHLKPPWPNNLVSTNIKVETGIEEAPEEEIRVYGRIAPRLRAVPSRFQIPQRVDRDLDLKVKLDWSGKEPGAIRDVTVTDDKLAVTSETTESGDQFVVLHVPAGYDEAASRATYVNVATTDPSVPSLRVQVTRSRMTPRPQQAPKPTVRRATVTPGGVKLTPGTAQPGQAAPSKDETAPEKEPPARRPVEHTPESNGNAPEKPSEPQ